MQIYKPKKLLDALSKLFEQHKDASSRVTIDTHFENVIADTIDACHPETFPTASKNITILLSDLRGFTAMTEKYTAIEVIELLNRYFETMSQIIHRHGGLIDKFMGDSIMVLFGALDKHEDDLSNALKCAVEMQIAMDEVNNLMIR